MWTDILDLKVLPSQHHTDEVVKLLAHLVELLLDDLCLSIPLNLLLVFALEYACLTELVSNFIHLLLQSCQLLD